MRSMVEGAIRRFARWPWPLGRVPGKSLARSPSGPVRLDDLAGSRVDQAVPPDRQPPSGPRSPRGRVTAATAATPDRRPVGWGARASTFLIFLVLGFCIGAWAAALPYLKAQFGMSDRGVSLALLTLAFGSVAATVGAGILTPRIGTGRATIGAAIALVALFSTPALAGSFAMLLVLTFLFGLANGTLDMAMNGHASDVEARWRAPIMSSFHRAFSLGGLAGASFGGALAALDWTAGGQLRAASAVAAVLVAVAVPLLGRGARSDDRVQALAWPERATLALGMLVFFGLIVEGAMADWSAIYLTSVAGSTKGVAAMGYAAFSVAMATGRLVGDPVVKAAGRRPVVAGGGLIATAGLALAVGWPTPLAAVVGFALVGIGLSNAVPVVFSAAAAYGRSPAAGIATVATVGYAGFLTGPPLIGGIASAAGLRAGIAALIVATAIVAVLGRFVEKRSVKR